MGFTNLWNMAKKNSNTILWSAAAVGLVAGSTLLMAGSGDTTNAEQHLSFEEFNTWMMGNITEGLSSGSNVTIIYALKEMADMNQHCVTEAAKGFAKATAEKVFGAALTIGGGLSGLAAAKNALFPPKTEYTQIPQ